MAKDFVPSSDKKLMLWLEALKTNAPAIAANLDLTPTEIARLKQLCTEYIDQITLTAQLIQKAKAAVTEKKSMRKTHAGPLRKLIKKMKTSPNYSEDKGVGMGVLSRKGAKDWGTYQPSIKVSAIDELIEIKFRKHGMDSMEFHGRPGGGEWQYLGIRSRSPFYFKPKEQTSGTIIKWEFTGRAIVKDEQVGVPSIPVSVVYAAK